MLMKPLLTGGFRALSTNAENSICYPSHIYIASIAVIYSKVGTKVPL